VFRRADIIRNHAPRFPQSPPAELTITATLPEASIEIAQFEDVKKAAERKD
jgi:hypothetical protein